MRVSGTRRPIQSEHCGDISARDSPTTTVRWSRFPESPKIRAAQLMSMEDVHHEAPPRTGIIATLGPSTDDPEVLRRIIESGASIFRINFSHGAVDSHKERIAAVREIERSTGGLWRSWGIFQAEDTPCGDRRWRNHARSGAGSLLRQR